VPDKVRHRHLPPPGAGLLGRVATQRSGEL
jgi:hypothetical protein